MIIGGGDSALDWSNELYNFTKSTILVHRKNTFKGMKGTLENLKNKGLNILTPYEIQNIEEESNKLIITLKPNSININMKILLNILQKNDFVELQKDININDVFNNYIKLLYLNNIDQINTKSKFCYL